MVRRTWPWITSSSPTRSAWYRMAVLRVARTSWYMDGLVRREQPRPARSTGARRTTRRASLDTAGARGRAGLRALHEQREEKG
jgi:hypothetical protein